MFPFSLRLTFLSVKRESFPLIYLSMMVLQKWRLTVRGWWKSVYVCGGESIRGNEMLLLSSTIEKVVMTK
jgi:hypothetical protein